MAENKKSFIMYCEWMELFTKLGDDQAGRLIKHIFAYVNDQNPEPPDVITDIAFTQIKQQFKRDLKKYEAIIDRNRLNGSKGGRPKTQKTQSVISETQTNPKNPIKDKGERISDKGQLIKEKEKNIEYRKNEFSQKILPHIDKEFTREDANDFFRYWTEMNEGGKKMRFEMQKVFEVKKRIVTWKRNKKNGASKNGADSKVTAAEYLAARMQPIDGQNKIG